MYAWEKEEQMVSWQLAADENTTPNTHLEPCDSPGDLFYQPGMFDVCRNLVFVSLQSLCACADVHK